MTSRWDPLLAIQAHDTAIDQLEHRRQGLAERSQLAEVTAAVAGIDGRVEPLAEQRRELERSLARIEDEVASLRAKAERSESALYGGTVRNPRELQSLQEDVEAVKRRISQLEDEELELLVAAEPIDEQLEALAGERARLEEAAARLGAVIAEAEADIDAHLATERQAREAAAAGVEAVLLAQYEDLRSRLGGVAIARLEAGSCQGCHLRLPAMELDRIKHLPADDVVHCEECGRLLAR
jgi:predicted  nucleic acid-binding Zn-ribbon protein